MPGGKYNFLLIFAVLIINILSGIGLAATDCTNNPSICQPDVGGYRYSCVASAGEHGLLYGIEQVTDYVCKAGMVAGKPDMKICVPSGSVREGNKVVLQNCECGCSGDKCVTCGSCESCKDGKCQLTCGTNGKETIDSCGCSKTASGCKKCEPFKLEATATAKQKCFSGTEYCYDYRFYKYKEIDSCTNHVCTYKDAPGTKYQPTAAGAKYVERTADGVWMCASGVKTCAGPSGKCCGCTTTAISGCGFNGPGLVTAGDCQKCTGTGLSPSCGLVCPGTDTSCGCESCENCNSKDSSVAGWYPVGNPTPGCPGGKACSQVFKMENRDYYCKNYRCDGPNYKVLGTKEDCGTNPKDCGSSGCDSSTGMCKVPEGCKQVFKGCSFEGHTCQAGYAWFVTACTVGGKVVESLGNCEPASGHPECSSSKTIQCDTGYCCLPKEAKSPKYIYDPALKTVVNPSCGSGLTCNSYPCCKDIGEGQTCACPQGCLCTVTGQQVTGTCTAGGANPAKCAASCKNYKYTGGICRDSYPSTGEYHPLYGDFGCGSQICFCAGGATCSDPDGLNPSVYGTCTSSLGGSLSDLCLGTSKVSESVCNSQKSCIYNSISCPTGASCSNGACVSSGSSCPCASVSICTLGGGTIGSACSVSGQFHCCGLDKSSPGLEMVDCSEICKPADASATKCYCNCGTGHEIAKGTVCSSASGSNTCLASAEGICARESSGSAWYTCSNGKKKSISATQFCSCIGALDNGWSGGTASIYYAECDKSKQGSTTCNLGSCDCNNKLYCGYNPATGKNQWMGSVSYETNCVLTGKCAASSSNSCFNAGGTCIGFAQCIKLRGKYDSLKKYSDCSSSLVCCYPGSGTPSTAQSCINAGGDCVMYTSTCATRGGQIIGSCSDSSTSPYCCSVKPTGGTPAADTCTKDTECAACPVPGVTFPACINNKCGCCIGAGCNSNSGNDHSNDGAGGNPGSGSACISACQLAGYSGAACCTNDGCEGYTYIRSKSGNDDCAVLYPNDSPFCVCRVSGSGTEPGTGNGLPQGSECSPGIAGQCASGLYCTPSYSTCCPLGTCGMNHITSRKCYVVGTEMVLDLTQESPTVKCESDGKWHQVLEVAAVLMTNVPVEYSDSECAQGMLIAANAEGMPLKEGVLISDIAGKSAIMELSSKGKIKLTELCFSPFNVTKQEFSVVEKEPMACQSACKVNESCKCNILDCEGGMAIIKNVQGRPVNILQTFPIQFLYSLRESVEFIPESEGMVQVTAICFNGGKAKTTKIITVMKS